MCESRGSDSISSLEGIPVQQAIDLISFGISKSGGSCGQSGPVARSNTLSTNLFTETLSFAAALLILVISDGGKRKAV